MLVYGNATNFQVLEGDEKEVYADFESIKGDSRWNAILVLLEEEITQRDFSGWSMGFKNLNIRFADELPGFVHN